MKHLRHIFIPNSEGETHEVIELVGTGLAIYQVPNALWRRDEYYLIHLASGSRLISEYVTSFVHACLWIRRIKDLIDWTEPESSFKERHELEVNVRLARLNMPVE